MYFKEINEYYLRMMLLKTGIFMNKYIFFDILGNKNLINN